MKRLLTVLAALSLAAMPALAADNTVGGQVSVTTSAQTMTALLGLSADIDVRALTIRTIAGANTIYCGGSNVTNVPANARVVLTANTAYDFPGGSEFRVSTGAIYCVAATGTTTMFVNGAR